MPILALTFWSHRYDDYQLRRVAAQVHDAVKQVPDVSAATIIGGQRRRCASRSIEGKLAAYSLTPLQVYGALGASNQRLPAGSFASGNREFLLETGEFLRTADDVRNVVVGVANGRPVFVRDVAEVSDGGEEPVATTCSTPRAESFYPAVTLAVSKRKGTNAIDIAERVLRTRGGAEGERHPLRRGDDHHPQLRRDGGGEIQRTAVPHADRRDLGEHPDLAHAGLARIADRLHSPSR